MIRPAAALLLALSLAFPAAARDCPALPPDVGLGAGLPRFVQSVTEGGPVVILVVGLGGPRAAGHEGPFAQTLAQALEQGLPGREVAVRILPTAGKLAKDAAERLQRAAADAEPALVIWRTGLTDALARTDPARFAQTVRRVAEWLAAQSADLVLVDLAYHAGSAQEATYRRYVDALAELGRDQRVGVFRRYAITEAWSRTETAPPAAPEAESCMAEALATAVLRQAP
jgi:hypothetical protein